ncbi:3-hydroxybutyrate dehydrogenase [Cognaticolwellia beringensis]|uniref:3-hydroxybutyrate dehydrogenase n=1 Tax=Cognaticolwellia beringensis TaxID=1967665 RepID=A0A222G9Y8_9GAMM|nr:3-hydroxybutyrate dehydrogenase [Cognaticolwellia beringensis]ASP48689.1 3-hydroxybutyrate dehydrogenase [Cognaticolwellia beringensis]
MLNQKVALITGSTSGIGLATAHVLAAQGISLVLHGLLPTHEGKKLANEFSAQYGINAMFDNADLMNVESIECLIRHAIKQMGSVDILINNAGIQHTESAENFPLEKWNAIIAINLSAAFHAVQYALPNMKSNGWGRIINVASVHGLVGSVNKSAYCAAKHGLVGLTKVLALECAEQGITVNAICPGWVDTPLINDQISAIAKKQDITFEAAKYQLVTAKQPLPEMMAPEQIGEFILFLCSDSARSITGSALPMDGAWTAQ